VLSYGRLILSVMLLGLMVECEWRVRECESSKWESSFRDSLLSLLQLTLNSMVSEDPTNFKEGKAENNGVDWDSYVQSIKPRPGKDFGYNTCWVCKTNHDSVLTEAMAKNKFAKK
jgi:hypothetical protein